MNVAAMLDAKGREVITTPATITIADAADALAKHKIGALVVVDIAGRLSGIVSERDIVRAVARSGGAALGERLSSIMTREVVTCREAETVNEVMGRMTHGRFRHLPVVEGGKLVGLVSIGDVVKARISEVEREAEDMRSYIAAV
jgi:CBS domain-containing protein